jgi:hypothetical protein
MKRRALFGILATVSAACASAPTAPEAPDLFRVDAHAIDETTAAHVVALTRAAVLDVERFFGAPLPASFTLWILPSRAAFDASLPPEWGLTRTECWMVATGVAEGVRLLSPAAWKSEACEHDPTDEAHLRRLLAHELVHVYHAQRNPSPDFVDVSGIDWFVEGLATFASGQLADPALASAREALEHNAGPSALATAWTGRYRYGVSGSLVAFLEHEFGREVVRAGLAATSQEELLALFGLDEATLLDAWRLFVLEPRSTP